MGLCHGAMMMGATRRVVLFFVFVLLLRFSSFFFRDETKKNPKMGGKWKKLKLQFFCSKADFQNFEEKILEIIS